MIAGLVGDIAKLDVFIDGLSAIAETHRLKFANDGCRKWSTWLRAVGGGGMADVEHLERIVLKNREDSTVDLPFDLAQLADAYVAAGETGRALTHLNDALGYAEESGARFWNAELYRIKGECLLLRNRSEHRDGSKDAEDCLVTARAIAQKQSALSLELRASVSLARLWSDSGRPDEARVLLSTVIGRFTEGFETTDLIVAAGLLDELSQ